MLEAALFGVGFSQFGYLIRDRDGLAFNKSILSRLSRSRTLFRYALKLFLNPLTAANSRDVARTCGSIVALNRLRRFSFSSGRLLISIRSHIQYDGKRKRKNKFILQPSLTSIMTQSDSMRQMKKRTTITKTISLNPSVQRKGEKLAARRGFGNSFSAYIAKLILEDAARLATNSGTRFEQSSSKTNRGVTV